MARIRTVKPEFWQHPKVTRVSRDARLLFLGLLNEADDEGKMRYSAKRLAGVIFGEDDDVTPVMVQHWVDELEAVDLVQRYEVDDAPLLIVLGFTEHQSINRPSPSRLPNPSVNTHGGITEDSVGEQGTGNREQGSANGSRGEPFAADFDAWWENYPRKIDRKRALATYQARRREGATAEDLQLACKHYAEHVQGQEPRFVKHGATFLAKDGPWSEWRNGNPDRTARPRLDPTDLR